MNVDFDNEIYQIPQANVLPLPTFNETPEINESTNEQTTTEYDFTAWSEFMDNTAPRVVGAMICKAFTQNCTLACNDGSVNFVDEELEELKYDCPKQDLALHMSRCEFDDGLLNNYFFGGYFTLHYLAINECNLKAIQDAAFTHANVKNLETLILTNNQLLTLQASSLAGLTKIKYFEFKQLPLQNEFDGKDFVKSLATAIELIIQPSINSTKVVVDPLVWWQNTILETALYLDLSNTNMHNILNAKSFEAFKALESLSLFNCNVGNFSKNTFESVARNLKYLDVRLNHLKTLDLNFFSLMVSFSVEVKLDDNEWFCECDYELFEYFELYNAVMMESIVCHSPEEYYELDLKQLSVLCENSGTTALTTSTATSTSTASQSTKPTTTLDPNETDETTFSTEETFPTTDPTSIMTTSLKPFPTYSTSEISPTTTTIESVIPPESSTTSTSTISPIPDLVFIRCFKGNTNTYYFAIVKPKFNFTIYTASATSVRIEIPLTEQWETLIVVYFNNYNDHQSVTGSISAKNTVTIKNLQTSKVYLFCVGKEFSIAAMSPFDCQSHFLESITPNGWLLQQDKAWFLTTCIISTLILFVTAAISVYCLLRYHPYWLLQCNGRIFQVNNRPNEVLVLSRQSAEQGLR